MDIEKHLIITGSSEVSWKDAIVKAISETSKSIDYLSSVKILEQRAKIDGNKITANVIGNDEEVANLLKYLVLKDIPVLNYSRAVGNLEDVFIQITADSDEEEA